MENLITDSYYDDKTEILTIDGWKFLKDVSDNEIVATINKESKEVEFNKIDKVFKSTYSGIMDRYSTQGMDLLVTPDHKLYAKRYDVRIPEDYKLFESDKITTKRVYMTKKFNFVNEIDLSTDFILKGYDYKRKNNSGGFYIKNSGDLSLNREVFYKFLAWYLSEGSTYYSKTENKYVISLCQIKSEINIKNRTVEQIMSLINSMGFKCNYDGRSIHFNSLTLGKYLKELGVANTKYISLNIFRSFNKDLARIFIDEYFKGDGHIDKNGCGKLFTTSKVLSDQLMTLCFMAGYTAKQRMDDRRGQHSFINDHEVTFNYICYVLNVTLKNKRNLNPLAKIDVQKTHEVYEGDAYCINVKNNTVFVRRNGIAIWCGDTKNLQLERNLRRKSKTDFISEDIIIGFDNKIKGMNIKELFNRPNQYKEMTKLRNVNEKTHEIMFNKVTDVTYGGKMPLLELTTDDGYKITSTAALQFLTFEGWKRLDEIQVGEIIYTNGTEAYKSKEWLEDKYVTQSMSQEEIGNLCGVSKHTIRSWVRKLGLQKEVGTWSIGKEPPNKGKTKENYKPMAITSKKMHGNKNGIHAHHERKEEITKSGGYSRVLREFKKVGVCSICGECGETEVHHIDGNPKNDNPENLIELCVLCHKRKHKGISVKAVKPSIVKSIIPAGDGDTYNVSINSTYNNFVAAGFVVRSL